MSKDPKPTSTPQPTMAPGIYYRQINISVLYNPEDEYSLLVDTWVDFNVEVAEDLSQSIVGQPAAEYVAHLSDGTVTKQQVADWEEMALAILKEGWEEGKYRM